MSDSVKGHRASTSNDAPLSPMRPNEKDRLKAIARYRLDDPVWSSVLQDIARLAAQILNNPHGQVNIVGENIVWNAAVNSGSLQSVPYEHSFCSMVVEHSRPLLISDATTNIQFAPKPSVIRGELRNYYGVPLFSPEGQTLGSVCAWGNQPYAASKGEVSALLALSRQATLLLELHQLSRRIDEERANHRLSSTILSDIVTGKASSMVLDQLAVSIEERTGDENVICSIFLVEDSSLHFLAGPNFPVELVNAMDGLPVGETVGSCGRAAATGTPAVSFDIRTDPDWEQLREKVVKYGILSCCSFPILDETNNAIATFALYYKNPRHPDAEHWRVLEDCAGLVGLAIMRSKEQDTLRLRAASDALTGLPNRSSLIQMAANALLMSSNDVKVALFLCDLDGFKLLNDSLGHAHGDEFIIQLSRRLLENLTGRARVGRLGGDEFVVLCENIHNTQDAEELATEILEIIRVPAQIAGRSITLTGSIGLVIGDKDSTTEELLGQADAAMYDAKKKGKNTYSLADEVLRRKTIERFEIEVDLRSAQDKNELKLLFQPNVHMSTGQVLGIEALVRWDNPKRSMTPPSSFIPIAEESDLIIDLGAWILKQSCLAYAAKTSSDPFFKDVRLWVNVSPKQLAPSFISVVASALEESQVPANRLGLEITESIFMHDVDSITRTLVHLRANGISIAIDDFGTGFSSLAQLRKLPVDIIKIDKAFIDGIGITGADESVVVAIIKLGEALGIQTVAEGVETQAQRLRLLELGCNLAQGYLFGKPTDIEYIDTKIPNFS